MVFCRSFDMRRTGFYIFTGFPKMPISRWHPVKQQIIRQNPENLSADYLYLDELSV